MRIKPKRVVFLVEKKNPDVSSETSGRSLKFYEILKKKSEKLAGKFDNQANCRI